MNSDFIYELTMMLGAAVERGEITFSEAHAAADEVVNWEPVDLLATGGSCHMIHMLTASGHLTGPQLIEAVKEAYQGDKDVPKK